MESVEAMASQLKSDTSKGCTQLTSRAESVDQWSCDQVDVVGDAGKLVEAFLDNSMQEDVPTGLWCVLGTMES